MRGAFEHRSKEVINDCDYMVLIHDGESKGTANELKQTIKAGRPYKYYELEKAEYPKSNGFKITEDWSLNL